MNIRLVAAAAVVTLAAALAGCSGATTVSSNQPLTTTAPAGTSRVVSGSVWVADEGGESLTVVDAATNTVAMTVTGIKGPHNVQVGRAGATVYAVSDSNTVMAIDAATYTVAAVAATGSAPAHVIEVPNGKVYVSNSGDGTVSVYQARGLEATGRIDLGGMPHGLRPAAGGSLIVVANTMAGTVDLIDPANDRFLGSVPVGPGPAQVAVTADGRYAYAGITDPPAVVKVDLTARKVVGTAQVSASPVQVYLTPDETTVLSADQGTAEKPGHALSVIDTAAMTVRGTVGTGSGPHGVVIDTSGTRAWVTNTYDNTVSVIDLPSRSIVATIAVGTGPSGISYTSRPPAASGTTTATLKVPAQSPSVQDHTAHH
ncbi:hypothetical protein MycrhN_2836 [Mycolicibacterium rhodesiae NBB3]|uniref:YNCE-like beta-propeller domain-containing protein n=1 Tax=Mycolicibacterium rhodesiae (strain NBB3) TaxID=710685 RepID=G8RI67_MYCRN|nr:hypothetical protein [Mycolicibacterium rhodesiae]AEV73404.1 hypothetical protein MycrhN_2836 [Mycolicibacterium rhodesiae NBB3]